MTTLGENGLAGEREKNLLTLYQFNMPVRTISVNDAFKRRLLTVELVNDCGVTIIPVAQALESSRTTVYKTFNSCEGSPC